MAIEGLVSLSGRGRVVVLASVRGILHGIAEDALKALGNISECCSVCVP